MNYITFSRTEQRHPFHMVDPSPWPLTTAFAVLSMALGGVMYMHTYSMGGFTLFFGFIALVTNMYVWFRDITREATYQGHHTEVVQVGIRYGMLMFIVSEIMFFFAFFWAFFHSSLAPSVEIGCCWPPAGIEVFSPWEIPLLNTVILLSSGVTVTWAHHAIVAGQREQVIMGLIATVGLGAIFTCFQAFEYAESSFTLSDGIYGSTFFLATGFHGFHVLVGTIMLLVMLVRQINYHFTQQHHFGFEAAAWYWHFVDVVWLFLFTVVYWWGGA
jgi:cytochrome c oxidase subunit 3|tara:strand:+ start:2625 stop:3440 length:816 start_codon:yes stop_codon:yes gene_type:complete